MSTRSYASDSYFSSASCHMMTPRFIKASNGDKEHDDKGNSKHNHSTMLGNTMKRLRLRCHLFCHTKNARTTARTLGFMITMICLTMFLGRGRLSLLLLSKSDRPLPTAAEQWFNQWDDQRRSTSSSSLSFQEEQSSVIPLWRQHPCAILLYDNRAEFQDDYDNGHNHHYHDQNPHHQEIIDAHNFETLVLRPFMQNVLAPNARYQCDYFVHLYYHEDVDEDEATTNWLDQNHDNPSFTKQQSSTSPWHLIKDAIQRVHGTTSGSIGGRANLISTADTSSRDGASSAHEINPIVRNSKNCRHILWSSQEWAWHAMEQHSMKTGQHYSRVAVLPIQALFVTPIDVYRLPRNGNDDRPPTESAAWQGLDVNNTVVVMPAQGGLQATLSPTPTANSLAVEVAYGPYDAMQIAVREKRAKFDRFLQQQKLQQEQPPWNVPAHSKFLLFSRWWNRLSAPSSTTLTSSALSLFSSMTTGTTAMTQEEYEDRMYSMFVDQVLIPSMTQSPAVVIEKVEETATYATPVTTTTTTGLRREQGQKPNKAPDREDFSLHIAVMRNSNDHCVMRVGPKSSVVQIEGCHSSQNKNMNNNDNVPSASEDAKYYQKVIGALLRRDCFLYSPTISSTTAATTTGSLLGGGVSQRQVLECHDPLEEEEDDERSDDDAGGTTFNHGDSINALHDISGDDDGDNDDANRQIEQPYPLPHDNAVEDDHWIELDEDGHGNQGDDHSANGGQDVKLQRMDDDHPYAQGGDDDDDYDDAIM